MESSKEIDSCPVCGGQIARNRVVVRAGKVGICGRCGSWHRLPRPTPAELALIYDRQYYDAWGLGRDTPVADTTKQATFRPILRALDRLTRGAAGPRRILDVGAATGILLDVAAGAGWDPYAVELNPYGAEVLRQKFGGPRVHQGELVDCPFGEGLFQAVTMTDVIEHVLDIQRTLEAARRLLAPGGALVLTTPRIDSLSRLLSGANWPHFKIEHVQYFTAKAIGDVLRRAGFGQVRIRGHSKRLAWDYLELQLQTYPHWLLTPLTKGFGKILPKRLRRWPMPYRCGEMLVLARRGPDPSGG